MTGQGRPCRDQVTQRHQPRCVPGMSCNASARTDNTGCLKLSMWAQATNGRQVNGEPASTMAYLRRRQQRRQKPLYAAARWSDATRQRNAAQRKHRWLSGRLLPPTVTWRSNSFEESATRSVQAPGCVASASQGRTPSLAWHCWVIGLVQQACTHHAPRPALSIGWLLDGCKLERMWAPGTVLRQRPVPPFAADQAPRPQAPQLMPMTDPQNHEDTGAGYHHGGHRNCVRHALATSLTRPLHPRSHCAPFAAAAAAAPPARHHSPV